MPSTSLKPSSRTSDDRMSIRSRSDEAREQARALARIARLQTHIEEVDAVRVARKEITNEDAIARLERIKQHYESHVRGSG